MAMDVSDDLTCHELVELVTDYLEGALDHVERARLEAHLDVCPGCREYLEQMRQTIGATGHLPADLLDPRMQDRLLHVFREWRRSR
jgi:anti-sigma factor RsiW